MKLVEANPAYAAAAVIPEIQNIVAGAVLGQAPIKKIRQCIRIAHIGGITAVNYLTASSAYKQSLLFPAYTHIVPPILSTVRFNNETQSGTKLGCRLHFHQIIGSGAVNGFKIASAHIDKHSPDIFFRSVSAVYGHSADFQFVSVFKRKHCPSSFRYTVGT